MLQHARPRSGLFQAVVAGVVVLVVPLAKAQTIADYSRAQRAMLENTMSQAAARSAGLAPSAPAVAASAAVQASPAAPRAPAVVSAPSVQVSGVFASGTGAVAEVVVNATAYLLTIGQGVPGTSWHVESLGIDRVVLARQGAAGATDGDGVRKVFPLPALR